jgi:hypothetical protein
MTMLLVLLGIALLGGLLYLIVRQIQAVRANQALGMRELQKRLIQPDWALYAQHLERPVPEDFQALYSDYALLLSELELPLSEQLLLTEMYPLDAKAIADQRAFHISDVPFAYLPFATCAGNELFLRPGADAPDNVFILEPANAQRSGHLTWRELYPHVAELRAAIAASVAANKL